MARPAHASYGRCLSYANRCALAHTYNRGLEQAADEDLVVFCHDDVWLSEQPLVLPLTVALELFDLVGVAGDRRRLHGQQAWWLNADGSGWDHPQLVGALRHGRPEAAQLQTYCPSPAPAALLDGVLLAGRAGVLRRAGLSFDPDLPFHLYDLDFCRSAEQAGLRLGVWPLDLIHASGGETFTPNWKACLVLYRRKWEPPTPEPSGPAALRWHHTQALLDLGGLLMEVEGFDLARAAFQRVLRQQPTHGTALFGLGQCQEASGDTEAALATYTRGLEYAPGDLNLLTMAESMRLGLCLWDDHNGRMQRLAERLQQGLDAGDPVPMAVPMRLLSFPLPLELPRRLAARHAAAIAAAMAPFASAQPAAPRHPSSPGEERPLRIGYLCRFPLPCDGRAAPRPVRPARPPPLCADRLHARRQPRSLHPLGGPRL
ncbi:MAG: tetratricopeptide repeat protein [Cyanobacteria bacterium]|nr:tetratricopeptide repeat protein [Cyanobacteriota bacterium]